MKSEILYAYRVLLSINSNDARESVLTQKYNNHVIYRVYFALGNNWIKTILLFFIALLKNFPFFIKGNILHSNNSIIVMAQTYTEKKSIAFIKSLVPTISYGKKDNFPFIQSIMFITSLLRPSTFFVLLRVIKLIKIVFLRHPLKFFINLQFSIFLFHYLFARYALKKTYKSVVIVSNDHSPEPLALSCAARSLNMKTCYIQHAHVTPDFPWLNYDLSILDNKIAHEIYTKNKIAPRGKVIYRGLEGEENQMLIPETIETVGICLTNYEDENRLKRCLKKIQILFSPLKIKIRQHPASTKILTPFLNDNTSVSPNSLTLAKFIKTCDLIIAGNTSTHLQILKAGVPTLYNGQLDQFKFDTYGFIEQGIVLDFHQKKQLTIEFIKNFYLSPCWLEAFKRFDPFYNSDDDNVHEIIKQNILSLVDSP